MLQSRMTLEFVQVVIIGQRQGEFLEVGQFLRVAHRQQDFPLFVQFIGEEVEVRGEFLDGSCVLLGHRIRCFDRPPRDAHARH